MPPGSIFVFGSNLAGRHGKGAAKTARLKHGAIYGQGVGRQGMSYAIPTKNKWLAVLPLSTIKTYVDEFISYAKESPDEVFYLTRIGCGYAGYEDKEIAPLFNEVPDNVIIPDEWKGPFTEGW